MTEPGPRELLMDALLRDLRCLDAHAHLGNLAFDGTPEEAILHYEVGVRIGELPLPAGFEGVLPWGALYIRPFLRCLHGYGCAYGGWAVPGKPRRSSSATCP